MYQVHIRNKTTCRTVKYNTTVHRRKYQLHFKNVEKSIILMVRLKADNELCFPLVVWCQKFSTPTLQPPEI